MKTAIDDAGRLVVPKPLRDQLSWKGGTVLEVTVRDGRLELEPVPTPMRLVRRDGRLVATTDEALPRIDADDVHTVVAAQRR